MKKYFVLGLAAVTILAAIFWSDLIMPAGASTFQKRLAGVWDIDDKASWEFQNPGETYAPSTIELWRNISLRFDTKEQTCFVQTALGNELIRYRVLAEDANKATLSIGERSFVFEFQTKSKVLFYPSGSGIVGCLIMSKGNSSAESESKRAAKAEHRFAEIVKLYTRTVASRAQNILTEDFSRLEQQLATHEGLKMFITEVDAHEEKKAEGKEQTPEGLDSWLESLLRDTITYSNISYCRVYASNGTLFLSSDVASKLPAVQLDYIKHVARTEKAGSIVTVEGENGVFFMCHLPLSPPEWNTGRKSTIGVLELASHAQNVLFEALKFNFQAPQGEVYLIQFTGQRYKIIGSDGILREHQSIDLNDSAELPFAKRSSLVNNGEVCSQASHGPSINSWILFETNCISAR